MTIDIENELRELFRDKAGEAPLAAPAAPASAPPHVLRRGRRRQLGTVLGSLAAVVVVIGGSVAGLQRLLADGPEPLPTAAYDVFERTATVEAFTVTGPSDWYLVNEWPLSLTDAVEGTSGSSSFECQGTPVGGDAEEIPECSEASGDATVELLPVPHGLPMIQLTNVDMGLDANACADGIPSSGAALYVAYDAERGLSGIADPTIPPFPPGQGLPPERDGACGPGRYANFTVNGEPFFAWIGLGSDVIAEDREMVETAYERMSVIPDWTLSPPDQLTPAYVVAGGATAGGDPWRLEARPGQDVTMTLVTSLDSSDFEFTLGDRPVIWCCPAATTMGESSPVIFGTLQLGASAVEFQPDNGGDAIPGTIVPTPPMLGSGFDLFFLAGAEGLTGDVVAVGIGAGDPVEPSPSASPTAGPRSEEVEFSGEYEGVPWLVRATGSFEGGDACFGATVGSEIMPSVCHDEDRGNPLIAPEPSADSWTTDDLNLFVTSVDPAVVELRFRSDDGSNVPSDFQCAMGPTGWTEPDRRVCVLPLRPQGSGTLEFLDASGTVLFEQGMGWGSGSAAPPAELGGPGPVQPVHGRTYWAVYPWLGPAASDESNQVVGDLSFQFGIQASQGELNCDDGAREALGTDAAWAVAVYFDTRADAQAFSDQLAISGGIPNAPIARVTTYCLD